jgi:hypothetical protein
MSSGNLLPTLWHSIKVTLRVIWRVARQVFHEATGTLFAIFGGYGLLLAWRQWHYRPVLWLTGLAILYAVMMAAFAFGAFRRARRLR